MSYVHDDECLDPRDCPHWRAATQRLNYVPAPFAAREALKREGRAIVHSAASPTARATAAEWMLRAWFDRSLEHAIDHGYESAHPLFPRYIQMMHLDDDFSADVVAELRRRHGAAIADGIARGDSDWRPS